MAAELTPAEAEAMREVTGLTRDGDRLPAAADVAVILECRAIIEAESRRWFGLDLGER